MLPLDVAEITCLCTQTCSPGCPEGQPEISLVLITYGAQDWPARPHCLVAMVGTGHTPVTRDTYMLPAKAAAPCGMGIPKKPHHLSQNHLVQILGYICGLK